MSLILSGTDGISDVDGSASTPALRGTDANTGIFFPAADTIAFSEGGVESMRIDSAGNVGIGTASPVEKLTVAGSISTNIDLVLKQGTTDRGYIFGTSSGLFYRATSGLPHVFQNVGTELMRIDSSGNVSLGGAAATARLYLSTPSGDGTVNISGDGTNYAVFRSQGASFYQLGSLTSVPMTFITNGTERMRISSAGYVTTPSQPAFLAVRTGTSQTGISTGTNLIYNTTRINVGSGYDNSTGTFTAPVTGTYIFTVVALFGNLTIGQKIDASLITSNREYYSAPGRLAVASGSTTWSGDYIAFGAYTVADMDAGDTAVFRVTSIDTGTVSMLSNEGWCRFSGTLIG